MTNPKKLGIMLFVDLVNVIVVREWRNWQTRTFEGRVGNRTGSSPVSRTIFIAGLCKGSTADSDSVCLGSNPSPAARKKDIFRQRKMSFFQLNSLTRAKCTAYAKLLRS